MGVVYSIDSNQQSPDPAFYGKSSVASLLSSIPSEPARERSGHDRLRQPLANFANRNSISRPTGSAFSRNRLWFHLPPRCVADDLLGQYWSNNHLYYPWFHTQSFQKAYEALWDPTGARLSTDTLPRVGLGGSDCPNHVFNVALNAAFALGCEGSNTATDQPEDTAAEFMDRAFGLLHTDLLDSPNLSLVQALLLVIEYLQSTQKVNKTWGLMSSVCAMAQGLGLHLSHNDSQYTVLEIEMRRRAWHGCVFYDRITSMTFGRFSVLLGAPKVPLFSPIDDEYLNIASENCHQPAGKLSRVAFAVENVKLGHILGNILQQLYSHQVGNDSGSKTSSSKGSLVATTAFDALAVLDASLTEFETELPDRLKLKHWDDQGIDEQEVEIDFLRQSYVLRARVCAQSQQNGRGSDKQCEVPENKMEAIGFVFEFHCALASYQASCDMIQLLHTAIIKGMWGAWWYAIYYIATSTIILTFGANDNRINTAIGNGKFNFWWHMAIETLEIINRKHPMAGQCAMALQAIRQRCVDPLKSQKYTTLSTGHPETEILPQSTTSSSMQADLFPTDEPLRLAPGDWQSWSPTQQAFASLNEMDLDNFGDMEGFLPLFENLQNSFGSGMTTGTLR
ncbi:uncharacterized protein A1O9_04715 [Exophiala aquamarina CBS 119918]|uniref:Xylanolytic transcriptional activator regulatory domain-containing protein n=1 Tax=Exophiala aquamarina CBS 119918 TaxID=1182545 RepID=A0A072PJF8_9EURO|nr:uncharacterized protein A1O9_04715 [Exophiala aquamarina CBS 119918]KEF59867.1 hypothetical protein A1O9_04715 [Exophiala aquamarina CBS 119918]